PARASTTPTSARTSRRSTTASMASADSRPRRFATLAPAKVNLTLRVGKKRADGYHDIDSLFVPLTLADEVEVTLHSSRRIRCQCPGRPEPDGGENLGARAARVFFDHFEIPGGCDIVIRKHVPVTAGLGGGSSDAAAVLKILAAAFRIRDRKSLLAIAAEI